MSWKGDPTYCTPGGAVADVNPGRWIVSQEGSRQTYAVPLAFHRLGLLRLFYVDTWCRWARSAFRQGPRAMRAFATHFVPELPAEKVVSFNSSLIISRARFHYRKPHLSPEELSDEYCRFGETFARLVRQDLQRRELCPQKDLYFGFNTNCLEVIEYLHQQRVFTLVDQVDPGKVEEDLCVEEGERWPGWAKTPGRMPQSYWDRLKAEWDLADLILVNSEWSADAVAQQGVPPEKVIVVPLAIDLSSDNMVAPREPRGTLKVLWLGSIILRKGIQYLVEAARTLQDRDIEFLLVGPNGISEQAVRSFPPNMKVLGQVTRDQLGQVYQQAHVFVLPTISDGFAITQLEAMAHGLPVVVTPNCGQVVTHGKDGLIVPARNSEALAEALARLNDDRPLLRAMSANALRTVGDYDLPSNARLVQGLVSAHRKRVAKTLSHVA